MAAFSVPGARLGALLLLLSAVAACSGGGAATGNPMWEPPPLSDRTEPPPPEESHLRMIEELRRVAEQSFDVPYLGNRTALELRRRLAELDAAASADTRAELHYRAGQAELNLGNVREGIEHLRAALDIVGPRGGPTALQVAFDLGVGYMRLGETENCCLRNAPESCILPIRGAGVHVRREGSEKAIEQFRRVLEDAEPTSGQHLAARWLFNVAYMTLGEYPDGVPEKYRIPPERFRSEIEFPRFPNVAARVGLDTFNLSGGAVVDDFDGDEYLDVLTSTWDLRGPMRLFRNERDGTFSERTRAAGLEGLVGGLNMVQGDYDNDGAVDVLVLRGAWLGRGHPNSLLRNRGDGSFVDVTFEAGLGEEHRPTQVAGWADYDNDGDLDLFVGNETTEELRAPGQLFRNEGDGTFTDVAEQAGVAYVGYPKGVAWGDYDNDGDPDLYVSDYRGPNALYRNEGDGTFRNVAAILGVIRPTESFPVWFWDYDNDGNLDLFVASYTGRVPLIGAHYADVRARYEIAALYRGDGSGGFHDVAREAGLTYPMLPMGANFGDLDGDGWLDFYLGTGDPAYQSLMPNLMFLNRDGRSFVDVTMAGGFGHLQKGHSVAFADLDNDGDLDVFEQMGGAFPGDEYNDALYENPGFGHHWISLRLVGTESNRSAIGARIRIDLVGPGGPRSIHRHVGSGGSFGANPLRQTIGLGGAERIETLEIRWPTSGRTQVLRDVPMDRILRIVEGEDRPTQLRLPPLRLGGEGS